MYYIRHMFQLMSVTSILIFYGFWINQTMAASLVGG